MARETRDSAIARANREAESAHVYQRALNLILHCGIDHEERMDVEGGSYTFTLLDSASPTGGYLIETWTCPNQRALSTAYYFDRWADGFRESIRLGIADPASAAVFDRLLMARNRKAAA